MKPASAKAKGRKHQQRVREEILAAFPILSGDDVVSRSSGAAGEDLILSPEARGHLPISIECKATRGAPAMEALRQARANANGWTPVVAWRPPRAQESLVTLALRDFLALLRRSR